MGSTPIMPATFLNPQSNQSYMYRILAIYTMYMTHEVLRLSIPAIIICAVFTSIFGIISPLACIIGLPLTVLLLLTTYPCVQLVNYRRENGYWQYEWLDEIDPPHSE